MLETVDVLDPVVRTAYLRRLGVEAEPPSPDALQLLVQRHVERVPYETLWITAGERWTTDATAAAERIALSARGGYCYHLNGALGLLLESLGYDVHRHVGGVRSEDPDPDAMGNHLVLTVAGLPSEACPEGRWYVDAGLGDALHEPVPLVVGPFEQAPFRMALEQPDAESWMLRHDASGGFHTMTWTNGPASSSDFAAKHEWLSTARESGFVKVPMAERRDATGVDVIRGLVLGRVGSGAFSAEPILAESEWFEVLGDLFALRFEGTTPQWRHHLWDAVLSRHRVWEASGRG